MAMLIFALIVLIIAGLCIYGIDLVPFDPRLKIAAKILVIVIAILALVDRAGLV